MAASVLAEVRRELPVALRPFVAGRRAVGLVVVDEVNGFATPGAGALAPPGPDPTVARMVAESDRLAHAFVAAGRPVLALLDTHQPGKAEPPYPPHCEVGSGEENLVPALSWLEREPHATLIRKDCIDGFIGAIDRDGRNRLLEWINRNRLDAVVVVGICTDICVMDLVVTLLSARNHGLMPTLADVVVHEPGCATYDLPGSHPQALTHHIGLYVMGARGANLASSIDT